MDDWMVRKPEFEGYREATAGKRHERVAEDGVEDLLDRLASSWAADGLFMAYQAVEDLKPWLMGLIGFQHMRVCAECRQMERELENFRESSKTDDYS